MKFPSQTRSSAFWALLAVVACFGCSGQSNDYDATVQGAVTIDGELVKSGTVTFFPVSKGPTAVGVVGSDGSYALRIGQGNASNLDRSKVPSGKYVATVTVSGPTAESQARKDGGPQPLGPQLMADKYLTREASGLEYEVEAGLNVINIALDGPWANPPPTEEVAPENEEADATNDDAPPASPTEPAESRPATEDAPSAASPAEEPPADESAAPPATDELVSPKATEPSPTNEAPGEGDLN